MAAFGRGDSSINVASFVHGAHVLGFSSEVPGCAAANVLDSNTSKVWLTDPEAALPQYVAVELKHDRGVVLRTLGWFCWHAYATNPAQIDLHVSRDGLFWTHWDSVTSECRAGIQLHKIRPFHSKENPFVKVEVVRTFGAPQTYMNRLYLHSDLAEDMRRHLGYHKAYDNHREKTKRDAKKSAANGDGKQHSHPSSLSDEGVMVNLRDGDRIGDDAARTFGTKTLPRSASSSTSGRRLKSVGDGMARDSELGSESRPNVLLRSRRQNENKKQELQTDEGRAGGVMFGTPCWKEGRRTGQQHAHQQQRCIVSELQALNPLVDSSMVPVKRSKNAGVARSPGASPMLYVSEASSAFAASLPDRAVSMDAPFWNCGDSAKTDYRDATTTSAALSKAPHNASGSAAGNTLARMDARPMNHSPGDCAEWSHDQSTMPPNLINEASIETQSLPNDNGLGAVSVGITKATVVRDSHSRGNAEMETSREPSINLKQAIVLLHQKVRARHVLAAKLELQQAHLRLAGTATREASNN